MSGADVIFVEGDRDAVFVPIWDREDPWHCWIRAAVHCFDGKEFSFFVRMESARFCLRVADVAAKLPRPPRRLPPQFSWKGIPGKSHARFSTLRGNNEVLIIRDDGPWSDHPTITNDAEWVVEQLAGELAGRRLLYFDSENMLDELLVVDGKFAGFAPSPGRKQS